jgi:hypothetical protein
MWQSPQLLAVDVNHALHLGNTDAQRSPHEHVTIGMKSEPHRGHASAQFQMYLPEFLVLDIPLHGLQILVSSP